MCVCVRERKRYTEGRSGKGNKIPKGKRGREKEGAQTKTKNDRARDRKLGKEEKKKEEPGIRLRTNEKDEGVHS